MARPEHAPILIAGPTASGKSAYAMRVAEEVGGVVINADSMQVYRELRVLTARPSAEDEARVPHRLYGHVGAAEPYSVARWLEDVAAVLAECRSTGRRPIIVGGTGLYFKALTEGLSPVPPVPASVRERWRQLAQEVSAAALHEMLAARDPVMAGRLAVSDRQRVTRALEVFEATGKSLAAWQGMAGEPLVPLAGADARVLEIDRQVLYDRCDRRFEQMIEAGALDEVVALVGLGVPEDMPAMRAIGVRPLRAHLAGETDKAAATAQAQTETRQYVKRQITWLKKHMISWNLVYST